MGKGRTYNTTVLLNIIESVKPVGMYMWQEVAKRYQEATNESTLRDHDDIKRHFIEKLCNRGMKPTGRSTKSEEVDRAQAIQARILQESSIGQFGGENDNDDDENQDDSSSEEEKLQDYTLGNPGE
eukprot:gene1212-1632_t